MATAYTVNSSFLFITLILDEIKLLAKSTSTETKNSGRGLQSIDQITDEDGSLRILFKYRS